MFHSFQSAYYIASFFNKNLSNIMLGVRAVLAKNTDSLPNNVGYSVVTI